MNQETMWIDVSRDYDQPIAFECPNDDVDESANPLGWGRCANDDECLGYRECSAYGICMGKSYCDEYLPVN